MQPTITAEYLASQGLSPTFAQRFWTRVNKNGPVPSHRKELGACWIWTGGRGGENYAYGFIHKGGPVNRPMLTHRASWILHFGIPENYILHKCDNPICVNPAHLFQGTQADNMADMTLKGRRKIGCHSGEHNGKAELTWKDVEEIRRLYVPRVMSYDRLADMFGVCPMTIARIVRFESWTH